MYEESLARAWERYGSTPSIKKVENAKEKTIKYKGFEILIYISEYQSGKQTGKEYGAVSVWYDNQSIWHSNDLQVRQVDSAVSQVKAAIDSGKFKVPPFKKGKWYTVQVYDMSKDGYGILFKCMVAGEAGQSELVEGSIKNPPGNIKKNDSVQVQIYTAGRNLIEKIKK